MNFVATISYGIDSESKLFKSADEAKQWLDENNNNLEYTTFISEYDDNWKLVSNYEHTRGKEQ